MHGSDPGLWSETSWTQSPALLGDLGETVQCLCASVSVLISVGTMPESKVILGLNVALRAWHRGSSQKVSERVSSFYSSRGRFPLNLQSCDWVSH